MDVRFQQMYHHTPHPSIHQTHHPCIHIAGSHECDWPPAYAHLPTLTSSTIKHTTSEDIDRQVREQLSKSKNQGSGSGLYAVDKDLLASLRPNVIITQSLCRVCSVDYCIVNDIVQSLPDPKPILIDTNPTCVADVLQDIRKVGVAVNQQAAADRAVLKLQQRIDDAVAIVTVTTTATGTGSMNNITRQVVGFLEWISPIFCGGHWTPELIHMAGGLHPLNPPRCPSHTVSDEEFAALDPDIIIIACCGFDLETTMKEVPALTDKPFWSELKAVNNKKVWVVDGNQMFNRPGPRLVDALEWLVAVLHGGDDNEAEAVDNTSRQQKYNEIKTSFPAILL